MSLDPTRSWIPARMLLALALSGGCEGETRPAADAEALRTADAAVDASVDVAARAAVFVDCQAVGHLLGHTAEVTDTGGYVPTATVTLRVGQVARFGYADGGTEHTIVSGAPGAVDGLFSSPPFSDHGTLVCIQFGAPGTYPIHCDRHPEGLERGTITVEP
jgi:plastocyanin